MFDKFTIAEKLINLPTLNLRTVPRSSEIDVTFRGKQH